MTRCMIRTLPILVVCLMSGCTSKWQKPSKVCLGKEDKEQSISTLLGHSRSIGPFKGTGTFHIQSTDINKSLRGRIWVKPPDKVYLQGNVAFNPKGITVGSNEEEFWMSIKPEISTYWWGKWSEQSVLDFRIINPKILLEAGGGIQVEANDGWFMRN